MLSCEVICDLMAVYSSGEASEETRRLVEEHLARCPSCRKTLEGTPRLDASLSGDAPVKRPSNGHGFVSRTRRLVYAIGVGVLFFFSCQSAVLLRLAAKEVGSSSPRIFPGSAALWFGVAAGCLLLYIAVILVRTVGKRTRRDTGVGFALFAGILLCVLAVATFHLAAAAGTIVAGIMAFALLLSALVVTFARLPHLRYFTIVTLIVMLIANGVLIAEALGGLVMSTLLSVKSLELNAPGRGITPESAVRVDLSSLGFIAPKTLSGKCQ